MKLELDIQTAQNQAVSQNSVNAYGSEANPSEDVKKLLRSGINAAKEGNRAEARLTLLQVTETDPKNETAWLWLASISEYPEELLVFLQNVLKINPENERALEWSAQTKALLSKTFVQRGIDASHQNQKDFAKQCFLQAIVHDDKNEMAWLWLASSTESIEEKCSHLQKVLNINPENETALSSIKSVKSQLAQPLLKKANSAAIAGDHELACQNLEEAMKHCPELEDAWVLKAYLAKDFYEKIACYEKALEINPEHDAAQAGLAALKALAPKTAKPQDVVEEIVEKVSNQTAPPAEELLETVREEEISETDQSDNEPVELFSEVFDDAPTGDLEVNVMQNITADAFSSAVSQQEEVVAETVAPSLDFQPAEEPTTEEFTTQAVEEKEFVQEVAPQSEAPQNVEPVEPTPTVAEESQSHAESMEESVSEVSAESQYSFDESVESAATPVTENEQQLLEEQNENAAEEQNQVVDQVQFEEQEVKETVEFQPETTSSNGYVNYSPSESYADYQQPTVELSYQNAVYSDPQAETLTAYSPQEEVVAPQPNYFVEETSQVEEKVEETVQTPTYYAAETQVEPLLCPFCSTENEQQSVTCQSCEAMLSLSDLEMLLAHQNANQEVMLKAIERMEVEKTIKDFSVDDLTTLGLAHLNAHNLRKGFYYLQEAAQLNPNDVVLGSKVNFLAIRLSEIEEYDQKAQENPVQSKTIMVVDDSPTVRKLIAGKLEKCGHSVVSAVDGMDALAKINEVIPDLVLLDITMPRLDGYQVCKLIRNNDVTKDIPVVMISGKDGFFDKVRGRMAGSSGYITKPFGPDTLMKTIETYLA